MNGKHTWMFVLMISCSGIVAQAQDIIIRNDKTEIKSKVEEITETHIKYRKWENVNGPVYNLKKADVFIILYANGVRETIRQEESISPANSQVKTTLDLEKKTAESIQVIPEISTSTNSQVNIKTEAADYRPARLVVGLQSPFELGADIELRLIRNFLNIGVSYNHAFPKEDQITSASFGNLYASAYLPVNRMFKNYASQSKGLFIFCSVGIAYKRTDIFNSKTLKSDTYYSDFYTPIRTGADYYLTEKFGLHISTYSFSTFYCGIVSKI